MKATNRIGSMVLALATALLAGACVEHKQTIPTSPNETSTVLTAGNWVSSASSAATGFSPGTCGNFEWAITSLTSTAASGTFKAVCGGGITLQGNADGKLSGMTATITATGTATSGALTCPFALAATAVPQTAESVKVTYSGTVCGVNVSGTEVLTKR
jgi:hypothetical protein